MVVSLDLDSKNSDDDPIEISPSPGLSTPTQKTSLKEKPTMKVEKVEK